MIECLQDPKTWIFALFSCLDNIPNSLTNQSSIIIKSFGFTTLQTTLLGCVSGYENSSFFIKEDFELNHIFIVLLKSLPFTPV